MTRHHHFQANVYISLSERSGGRHLVRMVSYSSAILALSAVAATSGGFSGASAQTATQPPLVEAVADSPEIFVTAQRRSERLEDVPMTVTALSQSTLAAAGVNSIRDLSNVTTGFQLGQAGAVPQPAIRGVTTLVGGFVENNVAVYVDGIYQPYAQSINIDLPNVEGVQVLKGPQGTLYGRNATGGALLLNTFTPDEEWSGRGELIYARFDDKRASGYVTGPLNDRFSFSLAGYLRRSDGYTKLASRTTPGETDGNAAPLEQDAFRAKLKFRASDNLSAIFGYNYTRVSDARGNLFTPYENLSTSLLQPASATIPTKLGVAAWDIGVSVVNKQHEASMTLEWKTGIGTFKSITAYSTVDSPNTYDFDSTYVSGVYATSRAKDKTFQQAVDYSIDAIENLNLIVGATYFHDRLKFAEPTNSYIGNLPSGPGTTPGSIDDYTLVLSSFFRQKKEAWAAYADATFTVSDALNITVGGRYSEERQDVSGYQTGIAPRPFNEQSATFRKFTPRAAVRYEIAPRTNIYTSYSQGFRSGAFNSQIPVNPNDWRPAKQEVINAYEIGFKTAGQTFRLDSSAFYYDYTNLQVSATVTGSAGNPIIDITNAPKAKIKGIEGSFEWLPIPHLTLRGGATYLHARYGDGFLYSGVGVNPAVTAFTSSGNPLKTYVNVAQVQDLSGLQMARAPSLTAQFGLTYAVPRDAGGLTFAANIKYTSSYVVTNPSVWGPLAPVAGQRKQRFREGEYALLSASVTWTDPTGQYYGRLWGTNLTDHRYRLHYTGNASWGTYSPMAEPLSVGGTVGYQF